LPDTSFPIAPIDRAAAPKPDRSRATSIVPRDELKKMADSL